ncbi:RICIN domain-containing protein [Kitasatospora indigofera]|uniref:RICIN domain-containing protein n=1 Tax=Kitasatospora indigofera TaxID=67307 RepID=UPI0036767573
MARGDHHRRPRRPRPHQPRDPGRRHAERPGRLARRPRRQAHPGRGPARRQPHRQGRGRHGRGRRRRRGRLRRAVVRAPGDGSGARSFELKPLGDGYLRIVNQGSGEDVVVLGASRNAGAKIVQCVYAPGEKTNDEWLAEDAGSGNVRFANRYSGLYLTASATQGGQFEQRPYDGSGRQLFTVS